MTKIRFSNKWTNLVMACVRSVSYSVVVNGRRCGNITPSRGLRQGDPISPYLFLLCAEGFSSLLRKATFDGSFKGVAVARYGPKVSHLFFADDSLLFCKANKADCDVLCDILKSYEEASGQMVNFDKSSILFSPNTSSEDKVKAMDALKIHKQMGAENYLGLPIMFGRSKKMVFRAIKERIGSQTKNWSSRLLSQAGKSVLLQAVAQAIPIFVMNCFKLPKGFLNDLNMIMAKFWWGDSCNKSKIHWRKWETLCCSKMMGGLGFKEMKSFNLALLAKQWWRIIHNEKSLNFRVLKGKYFPNSEPMRCPKGPNSRPDHSPVRTAGSDRNRGKKTGTGNSVSEPKSDSEPIKIRFRFGPRKSKP